jgi:hypothetical protein
VEIKRLFSIVSKNGTGGEVTEVIVIVFRASDAGLLSVRRWLRQHRTLTSASDQLIALQCSEGVASDALVVSTVIDVSRVRRRHSIVCTSDVGHVR